VVRAPIVERDDSVEPVDRELSNRLNAVSVSETLTTPTVDSITDLLAVCTSQQTRTWSEFMNEITLLAQSRADSSPVEIIKVGEASYSEVYGIKAANDAGVVVKVIPLTPAQLDHRRVHRDAPDCSAPEDVKREIEITQRMSAMPEGGFVEFLK
jgi:serine/threonine-protein kinase haspin